MSRFSYSGKFMSTSSRVGEVLALFVVLLHASLSDAHPSFPSAIQSELSMPCTPACTICHKDNLGGFGTISEPFGKAMQAAGLTFVESSLSPALRKLESAGTDSDGDGTGDVLELREGKDPNGAVDLCGQAALAARYGCGAHIARAPSTCADLGSAATALLVALSLCVSYRRSARRRRPPRSHNG